MKFNILVGLLMGTTCFLGCSENKKTNNILSTVDTLEKTSQTVEPNAHASATKTVMNQKDLIMNEVVVLSNDFYAKIKTQDYTGANKNLHPDALKITPAIEWTKIYQNAQLKKGKLGFVSMYDHALKTSFNSVNGLGDYVELIFDAQYKDGNMREKLTYFRADSSDAFKILAYEYNEIVDKIFISDIFK